MKQVLVVEDNELESSQIEKILKDDLVEVTLAYRGQEAIQLIESVDYDCIILDYTLPDISGSDLISKVSEVKKKITSGPDLFCSRFFQKRNQPVKPLFQ
jgi:DNA-binding response OmpR family regulator